MATTTPTFIGFPLGVTSGSYSVLLDFAQASSWNAPYVTANGGTFSSAELALTTAIDTGRAYLNIHTSVFGGGEIRGFWAVPEPSAMALCGLSAIVLAGRARKKNQ